MVTVGKYDALSVLAPVEVTPTVALAPFNVRATVGDPEVATVRFPP
jgi:hypothetical protein